jgi:hypothetical protein
MACIRAQHAAAAAQLLHCMQPGGQALPVRTQKLGMAPAVCCEHAALELPLGTVWGLRLAVTVGMASYTMPCSCGEMAAWVCMHPSHRLQQAMFLSRCWGIFRGKQIVLRAKQYHPCALLSVVLVSCFEVQLQSLSTELQVV